MITDEPQVEITKDVLLGMKMQKIFKDFLKEINSIDFSLNDQFIVACDDNVINVIDFINMKKIKTIYIDQCDIDLVKFTDDQNHILCVTKTEPYEIQHWALEEHQLLKKFQGHTQKIYQLEYCKQIILTCSLDGTLRIWQINSLNSTCYGLLDLYYIQDNYIIGTIDPSCSVFAIAYNEKEQDQSTNSIQLYQMRKFEQGPFQTKKIQGLYINQIKFSLDFKYLLCVTYDGQILILDGFLLNILIDIPGNQDRMNVSVSFTPDSKFILTGSQNGCIHLYSIQNINKTITQTGKYIGKLEGHIRKCKFVYFSQQYCSIVSSCKNLVFWAPYEIQ